MKGSARVGGRASLLGGVLAMAVACDRDEEDALPGDGDSATEVRPGDALGVRGEADEELVESPDPDLALRVTGARLRDCDLSGPFYFFFEPGSAALRQEDLEHSRQLNQCLTRAASPRRVIVTGYGDLGSDDQSSSTLPLSRAHNIAQRVAMDVAPERLLLQAQPPVAVPEGQAAWRRRVEVQIGH